MDTEGLAPDEVVALHFDVVEVAPEVAAWCGGRVEVAPGADGEPVTTVWVPTDKGPRAALLGDWVVRRPAAEDPEDADAARFAVLDEASFAAGHTPA